MSASVYPEQAQVCGGLGQSHLLISPSSTVTTSPTDAVSMHLSERTATIFQIASSVGQMGTAENEANRKG